MVDTHCHLASFDDSALPGVLDRAWDAGMTQIVVPAGAPADFPRIIALAEREPRILGLLGFHPEHAGDVSTQDLRALRALLTERGIVGIGEAGIDHYWKDDAGFLVEQRALCLAQMELAGELGLPISLHLRDKAGRTQAAEMLLHLLDATPGIHAVLHSCTLDATLLPEFLARGCMIGYSGIATFPSAQPIRDGAALVPDDRILIETDAPYLAPVPHRGETNEPAYVRATSDRLAAVRSTDADAFWNLVGENARRVFLPRFAAPLRGTL